MTCRDVIEFLMDYQSGQLPEAERAVFDSHIAVCPGCVTYLKTYEETVQLGKAAFAHPDDPVSDAVPEELVEAILLARRKNA